MQRLTTRAPAKVNLTLRILGRRADGLHDLASLVAFADVADELAFLPGANLALAVDGPQADLAGPPQDNLVITAARAFAAQFTGARVGRFELSKHLPAAAGLGGGSADAAAALRLLAEANRIDAADSRLLQVARAVGADVTVCIDPRARLVHGTGEQLSTTLDLPAIDTVLVFPAEPLATGTVFGVCEVVAGRQNHSVSEIPTAREALFEFLAREANDLEPAARSLTTAIADARQLLEQTGEPRVIRMSGSGSSMFGLYDDAASARRAAEKIRRARPLWWVEATTLR